MAKRMRSSDVHAVARAIYGTILVTALVAALGEYEEAADWQILVSVLVTVVIFWMAHVYAELLSLRLGLGRRLTWREVRDACSTELAMIGAAIPATIALLGSVIDLYSRDTGVNLAVGFGVVALFACGALLGYRERAGVPRTIVSALVNGSFGIVIVALKALVH